MAITTTSTFPFEKIFLDIVGPLPETDLKSKYILTSQDDLSKFSEAIPLHSSDADSVAKALVTSFICKHGTPQTILTDQEANFLSKLFKEIYKLFKIKKLQTTAYHPQSNVALERSHRTLKEFLRHFIDKNNNNWDDWLPYAMFIYNTTPHTTTKLTPFLIIYGREAHLPTSITQSHPKELKYKSNRNI